MRETSKAQARRMREADAGIIPWRDIFKGRILDIGPGDDLLKINGANVTGFDKPDGDCADLRNYFAANTWDTIHSSNCLEHVHDASTSIESWIYVLKPGGFLIFTVPEAILYGDMLWKNGPLFNPDHKATFSLFLKGSPAPAHYHMPSWMTYMEVEFGVKCMVQRLIDTNYNYSVMFSRDQTFRFEDGVECFIECCLKKN